VVFYCSREHQTSDRPAHKSACNGIKIAQQTLATEEQKLRAHPGDFLTPANPMESAVGHFWGIHETRPYMRARYAVVEALLNVKSLDAVNAALDHVLDLLRLCRSDNMGVRELVPALFLRLGKDQECYDFVKWWFTTGQESDYDWGDTNLPFLDVRGADAFEGVALYTKGYSNLSMVITVTLLKIQILLDLRALQTASLAIGDRVPQEILDNISSQFVDSIVGQKKDLMASNNVSSYIQELQTQVEQLYKAVEKSNQHFWPALLNPGNNLKARPEMYSAGTPQQMQLCLQHTYESWVETPGAVDVIRRLVESDVP